MLKWIKENKYWCAFMGLILPLTAVGAGIACRADSMENGIKAVIEELEKTPTE